MDESFWLPRLREIARARGRTGDPAASQAPAKTGPAHDYSHVLRVEASARRIALAEGAEPDVVLPAALLHELRSYPKNHPDSPRSGVICAEAAAKVLEELGYPEHLIPEVARCIREHPYSLGVHPESLEGKVLQDADRLDAIGAIGVARCFAVCGELGRPLYSPEDPFLESRQADDRNFGLDHFYVKLLRVPGTLHTQTARAMARERAGFLQSFIDQLRREID